MLSELETLIMTLGEVGKLDIYKNLTSWDIQTTYRILTKNCACVIEISNTDTVCTHITLQLYTFTCKAMGIGEAIVSLPKIFNIIVSNPRTYRDMYIALRDLGVLDRKINEFEVALNQI